MSAHEDERRWATIGNAADQVIPHSNTRRQGMRLYAAICDVLESYAARLRTDTLEQEFDNADWTSASPHLDED
jgi:hypothetical protein